MPLRLTEEALRRMFPHASTAILDAFLTDQHVLAQAGILDNPYRLAYCFANLAHETGDWTIRNLTEDIRYTHQRIHEVWPNRYSSAQAVINAFGSAPGWQLKAFDVIYGNRMGNRPGTSDGSRYIGRGGPQVTGRDGYIEVGVRAGLDLLTNPEWTVLAGHQPAISAAFWSWKDLNDEADRHDFHSVVVKWNGGTNGLADRQAKLARILPIAQSLDTLPLPQKQPPVSPPVPKAPKKITPVDVAIAGGATGAASGLLANGSSIAAGIVFAAVIGFIIYKIVTRK